MAFWNRNAGKSVEPPVPPAPAPPPIPEIDRLAELLPKRGEEENYPWQRYVDRIIQRLDGLPAPDGGESFVRACLAAGCKAVPVMQTNTLWRRDLSSEELYHAESSGLAARVRLGLFLAGSLRYLVHGLCRLRLKTERGTDWDPLKGVVLRAGDVAWQPVWGAAVSFQGAAGGARRQAPDHLARRAADRRPGVHPGVVLPAGRRQVAPDA